MEEAELLVVNAGSSSLKLSLFRSLESSKGPDRLLDVAITGISESEKGELHFEISDGRAGSLPYFNFEKSPLEIFLTAMEGEKAFPLSAGSIQAVGHRVVHGGDISGSCIINRALLEQLKALIPLAPQHNPPAIAAIEAAQRYFQNALHVAVFDTAFHHTLPAAAAAYGLPYAMAERHHIKRYGFHGIAHESLWLRYAAEKGGSRDIMNNRAISLQLGGGCSLAAIKGGKCLDTTMGFTPSEGLLMPKRAGDLDPAIIPYLCFAEGIPLEEIPELLNARSGMLGVSGLSGDLRILLEQAPDHPRAQLAIDLFNYRLLKSVGAFWAVLRGVDALIFSGGIGENAPTIRAQLVESLQWQGMLLDEKCNAAAVRLNPGELKRISAQASKVELFVIGCDENGLIARETAKKASKNFSISPLHRQFRSGTSFVNE